MSSFLLTLSPEHQKLYSRELWPRHSEGRDGSLFYAQGAGLLHQQPGEVGLRRELTSESIVFRITNILTSNL
jgi:hypothetical protein